MEPAGRHDPTGQCARRRMAFWYERGARVRPIGAKSGSSVAFSSMRAPPIRSRTKADTWASLRRTDRGGSDPPSTVPDRPMAVGTRRDQITWT